jgi:hypothetical protein
MTTRNRKDILLLAIAFATGFSYVPSVSGQTPTTKLREAAVGGDVNAQLQLGRAYFNGTGVTQDFAEAIRWYRKSADGGNPMAQVALGAAYYSGTGVTQDYGESVLWFRKAADAGNAAAQSLLGYAYFNGQGVKK